MFRRSGKGIILVGYLVLFGLIFGGIMLFYKTDKKEMNAEKTEQIEEVDKSKDIGMKIRETHSDLNTITGWERYENLEKTDAPDWEVNEWGFKLIDTTLKEAASLTKGNLKEDLDRARKLLHISIQNHDTTALVYVHRILHDLDIGQNRLEARNVFNSAKAGAGDASAITTYEDYIKQHSK
ncbi:hypothetical protein [Bacillus cereus group sp. N21]|uniref:hypothetical protein n=1 Tax=Bacillus cereus group sp. N21 TaxID=2794591 RepID=UPI0018F61F9A|nr:hypothetical protein [Bacillus cereus group sp. N21]MBJ8027873.1 hypothetical protein [Bacillus cereus group sp. N21]